MSKIKFHLHKFEKQLYFQLLYIDPSLDRKGFICLDNNICIVNYSSYSEGYNLYPSGFQCGTNFRNNSGESTYYFNLYNRSGRVTSMTFRDNIQRDLYYTKILNSLEKSFKEDMWINC